VAKVWRKQWKVIFFVIPDRFTHVLMTQLICCPEGMAGKTGVPSSCFSPQRVNACGDMGWYIKKFNKRLLCIETINPALIYRKFSRGIFD
jgi:hypothetical protein